MNDSILALVAFVGSFAALAAAALAFAPRGGHDNRAFKIVD